MVVRKFPTCAFLLAVWCSFHLVRFYKSMKFCNFRSLCFWVRNVVIFSNSHNTARLRCGGHNVNCWHVSHPSGMRLGTVLSICASRCFVQIHISSPQSIKWCSSVSFLSQILHLSVGVSLILWSRSFVGIISCTRVGTLIVATIYLQLIQNRYMFRSFTVLQFSHQHCVQPVASDV